MRKIRVLVVDDAVVVRSMVTAILKSDPEVEVVGVAANGKIALSKIETLKPDILTLDIEMPEMNGLETLAELRKRRIRMPVIMFSTLTERGASTTLEALALGASDYVAKPANVGSVAEGQRRIAAELIPKIKALCPHLCAPPITESSPAARKISLPLRSARPATLVARPSSPGGEIDIVAIGVSTGGPNALAQMIPMISPDLSVPIVIVQHMPPLFTEMLAKRLDQSSPFNAREGKSGELLRPGDLWIAPGDFHMRVASDGADVRLTLDQGEPENSCRPAVDPLFRSVVEVYGEKVLGVILTGMGHDGLKGSEVICGAGGSVIAQDEASSVVWGMPGDVAKAGLANAVLPLDQIAQEINRRCMKTSREAVA